MARSHPKMAYTPRGQPTDEARLPNLLDINGVADHLGVNVRHVRRLVAERRIPYVKWGHLLRFDPKDIAVWIDASRVDRCGLSTVTQPQR